LPQPLAEPFDVITTGRISVDLYPEQQGVSLAEVRTFRKALGGSPTNVAVGAARLGCRTAVVTKTGEDGFGSFLRQALEGFGVETRWVGTHPTLRTPLAFCEIYPPDHFPLLFYREPTAPDMTLEEGDADREELCRAKLLWTTGTGLSAEPSRGFVLGAMAARAAAAAPGERPLTVHDLDYRPMLWAAGEDPGKWARRALADATVAVGNQSEVEQAVGTRDPHRAAELLLELGVGLAIVKCGPEGVLARAGDELIELAPLPIDPVNGLGAGDAFGAALCRGLVSGWPLRRTLAAANAAGAITASRLLCSEDLPTLAEIEQAMGATADA
jgi:5-dehydro-2-deoxygluconokinase